MDILINFIFRHLKSIVTAGIVLLIIGWSVSFFLSNSIIFLRVDTEVLSVKEATIRTNNLKPQKIATGGRVMIVIPRDSLNISAESDELSTLQPITPPLIAGNVDIKLKKHAKVTLTSTANTDCVYDRPAFTISWNCDLPDTDIKKTSYSDNHYPSQSYFDLSGTPIQYAKRYKDGLIGIYPAESLSVAYLDFTSGDMSMKNTALDNNKFTLEYTLLLVDVMDARDFVVFDQKSLEFAYYRDSFDQPITIGRLPEEFTANEKGSVEYTLENGILTRFSGTSSDDIDDHSGSKSEPIKNKILNYSFRDKRSGASTELGSLLCSNVLASGSVIACHDRDIVRFYDTANLSKPLLSVSAVSDIRKLGTDIILTQQSVIYRYDTNSRSLHAVMKLSNRAVASTYIHDSKLHASVWHTFQDSRQTRLLYMIDPGSYEETSTLVKNYPFDIKDTVAYGMDYHDGTIYTMLTNNSDFNRNTIRQQLQSKGLLDTTRQLFF